jgi:hypothetical protein
MREPDLCVCSCQVAPIVVSQNESLRLEWTGLCQQCFSSAALARLCQQGNGSALLASEEYSNMDATRMPSHSAAASVLLELGT